MIRKPKSHHDDELDDLSQSDQGPQEPVAKSNGPIGAEPESNAPIEVSEAAADVVKQLQVERDQAVESRLRALADFRNYQRRVNENEQRAVHSGAARIVKSIFSPLDHFDLALSQNPDQMSVKQLLAAVRIVRDELNKALASQGVERIEPAPGEPFDPHRHEAVMRQAAVGAAPNTIVSTLQAGYALGDAILRPAKVAIAPSEQAE